MGLRALPRRSKAVALGLSVALHALTLATARHLRDVPSLPRSGQTLLPISLDWVTHGDLLSPGAPGEANPPRPREEATLSSSGAALEARPDTRSRGKGGSKESSEVAHRLSDSVDGLTLSTDPTTFSRSNQISRIDTGDDRRSREDRRRTPNPMELTFLAAGPGVRHAKLEPAPTDPATGAFGAVPTPDGARLGERDPALDGFRPIVVGAIVPGERRVRALGVDHGARRDEYRRSAAIAVAHPAVRQGRASVPTTEHGRPDDTVDSTVEVADLVQALITASSAGGPLGHGPGGEAGGNLPGHDGADGAGSSTRPSGSGTSGGAVELGMNNYAAGVARKVYPFWEKAFPTWALVKGKGGVAVIGVTIAADGSVRDVHVVRPSGVPEFDQNVARALELASPYGPLPVALRSTGLELHIAFDAVNPGVGRLGPGPGRR